MSADTTLETQRRNGRVAVTGFGPSDVVFSSESAGSVIVFGPDGSPAAILASLGPGVWGFSKRGDDDWPEVVGIYWPEGGTAPMPEGSARAGRR